MFTLEPEDQYGDLQPLGKFTHSRTHLLPKNLYLTCFSRAYNVGSKDKKRIVQLNQLKT
jgi:hypothetical protein